MLHVRLDLDRNPFGSMSDHNFSRHSKRSIWSAFSRKSGGIRVTSSSAAPGPSHLFDLAHIHPAKEASGKLVRLSNERVAMFSKRSRRERQRRTTSPTTRSMISNPHGRRWTLLVAGVWTIIDNRQQQNYF